MTFFRAIETDHFKVRSASGITYLLVEKTLLQNSTQLSDSTLHPQKIYLVMSGGMARKIDEDNFYITATDETATRIPPLLQDTVV